MCRLSWNLAASPSWNPQGLSRPVNGIALSLVDKEKWITTILFAEGFTEKMTLFRLVWWRNSLRIYISVYSNSFRINWILTTRHQSCMILHTFYSCLMDITSASGCAVLQKSGIRINMTTERKESTRQGACNLTQRLVRVPNVTVEKQRILYFWSGPSRCVSSIYEGE